MSADKRIALVSESYAVAHPTECPRCQSKTVLLEGYFRRRFLQRYVDGRLVGEKLDETHSITPAMITCEQCDCAYVVTPDEVMELQMRIQALQLESAEQTLPEVLKGSGKPN